MTLPQQHFNHLTALEHVSFQCHIMRAKRACEELRTNEDKFSMRAHKMLN